MWAATGDPHTAAEVGRRGMVHTLVLRGHEGTRRAYAAYREARAEAGLPPAPTDNFAYCGLRLRRRHRRGGAAGRRKLLWFLNTSLKSAPQYAQLLPGTAPPQVAGQVWRTRGRTAGRPHAEKGVASAQENAAQADVDDGRAGDGAGHPVRRQSRQRLSRRSWSFNDEVGGFGHLTMIGRSGFMTHAESEKSIRLFGKEVLPRLKEIEPAAADSRSHARCQHRAQRGTFEAMSKDPSLRSG